MSLHRSYHELNSWPPDLEIDAFTIVLSSRKNNSSNHMVITMIIICIEKSFWPLDMLVLFGIRWCVLIYYPFWIKVIVITRTSIYNIIDMLFTTNIQEVLFQDFREIIQTVSFWWNYIQFKRLVHNLIRTLR